MSARWHRREVAQAADRTADLDVDGLALVVVDVQQGFADPTWGRRDNPTCEADVARLLQAWRSTGRPVVLVRHDSTEPGSPLRPGQPGNDLLPSVEGPHDLLVTKSVNSSFHGSPDLEAWLRGRGLRGLVVCGITTNHCCETTARVGGNLGLRVLFALDATCTFDRTGADGQVVTAEELSRGTAVNLHGEFATVVTTDDLVAAASRPSPALVRLDHLVLTVADLDATLGFYVGVLGAQDVRFGEGRRAVRFGDQKINLHVAGEELRPHATSPTPGSADLCFVVTDLDDVRGRLARHGVPVEEGPVGRTGAVGELTSVYVRDPDGNLVELSTYEQDVQGLPTPVVTGAEDTIAGAATTGDG